jgi:hypothetical protein
MKICKKFAANLPQSYHTYRHNPKDRMLDVRTSELRPLGRFAPFAVDSGLRPETRFNLAYQLFHPQSFSTQDVEYAYVVDSRLASASSTFGDNRFAAHIHNPNAVDFISNVVTVGLPDS